MGFRRFCRNWLKDTFSYKIGTNPKNRQSRAFYYSFTPVRIFLILFSRMPMQVVEKDDGGYAFLYNRESVHLILFFFSCGVSMVMFLGMTAGFVTMFFGVNISEETDKCGYTWEAAVLGRQLVPIAVTYTQLLLTFIGSFYIFLKGAEYVHYFNYWNRALEMMDMNISKGAASYGTKLLLEFMIVAFILIGMYAWGSVPAFEEASGFIGSLFVRPFIRDIYKGKEEAFRTTEFYGLKENCTKDHQLGGDRVNFFTKPTMLYSYTKLGGFIIQLYAMYSSRCFMVQFKFFCHLLGNCCGIWNERLRNKLHGKVASTQTADDQCMKRLVVSALLKDHLIIVQLFRLTEITYSVILSTYFPILAFNLILQSFYIPILVSTKSCTGQWHDEALKSEAGKCDNKEGIENFRPDSVVFVNPCRDAYLANQFDIVVALIMLLQNLLILRNVTYDGVYAHEQATQGWGIMRRHMFMWTSSKEHRNFVYSMINSLSAHNNPIWISVSGYYSLSKWFFIKLIDIILNYAITIVQFKPGAQTLSRLSLCHDANHNRVVSPYSSDPHAT